MADDPIIREMLAEQAYGPITSAGYESAAESAKANELGHSLGMDPNLVQTALPDMMREDVTRRRVQQAQDSAAYAKIISNWRFSKAAIEDDNLPGVANKIDDHVTQLSWEHPLTSAWNIAKFLGGNLAAGTVNLLGTPSGLANEAGELAPDRFSPGGLINTFQMLGPSFGAVASLVPPLAVSHKPLQQSEQALTPNPTSSWLTNAIGSGVYSAPSTVAALGAAALGQPEIGASIMAGQTNVQSYDSGRQNNLTPGQAAIYGATDAAIEAATEIGPERAFARLSHGVGGSLGKRVAEFLGKEIGGEMAATAGQSFDQWYWIDRQKGQTFDQYLKTLPDQEAQTVVAVLATIGLTGPLGHVVGKTIQRHLDAQTVRNVDQIMEAAAGSTSRTSNPTDFALALNQVLEDTPAEHLYVPADQVAKMFAGEDAPKIEDDPFWSKYQNDVQEGAALGHDIVVPLADAATHLAGTPQWDAIRDFVRTSPKGMSIAEAKDKATPQELDAIAARMGDLVENALPRAQQAQALQIAQDWAQQGGYTGDQAEAINRMLAANLYTVYRSEMAKQASTGQPVTPIADFAAQYLPTIEKQTQAQYDRATKIGTLEQKNVPLDSLSDGEKEDVASFIADQMGEDLAHTHNLMFGGGGYGLKVPEVSLNPSEIETSKATSPAAVASYAKLSGAAAPRVLVEKVDGKWRLIEGGHRLAAAKQRGDNAVRALDMTGMRGDWAAWFDGNDNAVPGARSEYDQSAQGAGGDNAAAGSVQQPSRFRGSPELLAAASGQELGPDQPLTGQPQSLNVPGRGQVPVTPHAPARQAATSYMRNAGLVYQPATSYAKVDVERATRIANAFDEMKHAPDDPEVSAAYQAMISETLRQFDEIRKTGLRVEFIEDGQEDPYAASPRLAILDVQENNHLWVFPTTGGFGQGEVDKSPMLEGTGIVIDGRHLVANDVFRIVHDYFGHIKDGHGFRAEGEENAWQSHAAMYTPLARRAMTTETRGQNSWLNYGPHGETNRSASSAETVFAPQKVGLMPEWTSEEGMLAGPLSGTRQTYDQVVEARPIFSEPYDLGRYGNGTELTRPPVGEDGQVQLEHFSQEGDLAVTDPEQWGRGKSFYSREERAYMRNAPPRTYFGIATNQPGGYKLEFQGRSAYRAKLPIERLYDAVSNDADLWQRGQYADSEWAIKNAGYAGYWVKHPQLGLVATVFEPVEVESLDPKPLTLDQALEPSGFERVAPFLSDEEKARMREASKQKLLDIIDTLPSAKEMAAVAHAGRAKKGWYQRSARAIVDVFGIEDAPRFAALLAALSPQSPVELNFYNAVKVWTHWNNAGRPTDRATILQLMGEAIAGNKGTGSILNAWINNSFAALTDPEPATLKLSGPKVNSFFANLVGVTDEVTNDSWMARYMGRDYVTTGGRPDKDHTYKAMSAVTREAARILTEQTGQDWTPMEVQETVWSFAKTLYEMRDLAGEDRTMNELLEAGGITHQDIAATPDFAVLFTDNLFRRILEEGGYGQQVADLASSGRAVHVNGDESAVTQSEGSGFAPDDFKAFLGQAADRLESVRDRRRANAEARRQDARQLSLTLNQDVSPSEEVFYSNATRAVEQAKQEKASPEQWAALLTPGRTPGIKAEEIEWTGILDWLKMQKGQVDKAALLQVLRDRGIKVEEGVMGEVDPYAAAEYTIVPRDDPYKTTYDVHHTDANGETRVLERGFPSEEAAQAGIDNVARTRPQFQNWSSDPNNPTYRELLITLPLGHGSNPQRAPSTHWDTEAVVAHVRFMEKTDAEGKRVLFIEEVQSDWHQKGRDRGYEQAANPEQKVKIAEAERVHREIVKELEEADAKVREHEKKLNALVEASLRKAYEIDVKNVEDVAAKNSDVTPGAVEAFKNTMYNQYFLRFFDTRDGSYIGYNDLRSAIGLAEQTFEKNGEKFPEEVEVALAEQTRLMKERSRLTNEENLAERELHVAKEGAKKGIPDAPFKTSWPALVMKRAIRWAAEHGYDKVAWTTGEEQASRYNLSQAVGSIHIERAHENTLKLGGSEPPSVKIGGRIPDTFVVTLGSQSATQTMRQRFNLTYASGLANGRSLSMTSAQIKEAFGNDLGGRMIEQAEAAGSYSNGAPVGINIDGEGLNVGGEGMKAFYDRNLVNITNDIVKKYGVKVGPQVLKEDEDFRIGDDGKMEKVVTTQRPGFEITPQLREAAMGGFPLFQQKRGNITINPSDNGLMHSAVIRAFEAANFSTAIHELGHFFLEDLKRRALGSNPHSQETADWQAFKDWAQSLGITVDDNGSIPVEAHEYFARGFERFTWEGKAPSLWLRAIFTRMREFMLQLYRSATAFNAPITPEIRDVMSRMLASQEEIDAQRAEMNLVSKGIKGLMSETEQKAYDDLAEESRQSARDQLFERVLSGLRRQKQAEYGDARDAIRQEVEAEVADQPIYKALKMLRVGQPIPGGGFAKVKLDRQWLNETYGEGIENELPKSVPPIVSDKDTMDADTIANLSGFGSGDELVKALRDHEAQRQQAKAQGETRSPRQREVDERVAQRLQDEVGDPYAHLEEEAQDAIASNRQADLMSMEVRALARKTGQKATPWAMAKEWAKNRIALQSAREAISGTAIQTYARAIAKAGREYEENLVKGDFEEAFRAKQRQLLNMALMSEAKKAANDVDAAVRRMQKLAKRDTIPSVEQDYLDQAHALLGDVDLNSNYRQSDKIASFAEWHAKQVELGVLPVVPPGYRELLGKTHWSRMSVPDLLELDKAVSQIVELGRLKQKLNDGKAQRDFDEGIAEMVGSSDVRKFRKATKSLGERTLPERARSILRSADAAMLKVEQIAKWLDGDDPTGPWTRLLFNPMADANGREHDLLRNYIKDVNAIIEALPRKVVRAWSNKVDAPELVNARVPALFKDQVVMMAMNWGNDGNKQRLLDGYGWNEENVLQVFQRLMTKEDWDFVQKIWDVVDKLWPDVAALERRVNGIAPEKVEATPVATPFGVYRGGYFPVIYDASMSSRAAIDEENKLAPEGGFMMVTTRAGSTKQRAEAVKDRPVLLSMAVITRHIGEVIHDVTHREAVMQAKKILGDKRIGDAVRDHMGPEYLKAMGQWLENIARPGTMYSKSNPWLIATGRYLNKAVTMVGLGFRFSTSIMQLLGIPVAIGEVGEKHITVAMATVVAHPVKAWNEMQARSAQMRARADTLDASIEQMVHETHGSKLQKLGPKGIQKYALRGIAYMDMVVSTTIWTAGFNKALEQGLSEEDAVRYADQAVRTTQGGGGQMDRSSIMNEHPMVRSFYAFFSYMNALFNMQRDAFRRAGEGDYLEAARRGWWVMIVPALLQAAIFGFGPKPDDDGEVTVEDWVKYLLLQIGISNVGSIPFAGTLASAIGNGYTYRSSAYNAMGEGIMREVNDTKAVLHGDKDVDGSTVKAAIQTAGLLTAQPVGQVGATVGGLYDYSKGNVHPQSASDWYNLLTRGFIPNQTSEPAQ
jgi:hypothetical protein